MPYLRLVSPQEEILYEAETYELLEPILWFGWIYSIRSKMLNYLGRLRGPIRDEMASWALSVLHWQYDEAVKLYSLFHCVDERTMISVLDPRN